MTGLGLIRTLAARTASALAVLLCVATVAFILVRLSGDPVKLLLQIGRAHV